MLFTSKAGERILATAPKDGHLYGFALNSKTRLYRLPLTTMFNVDVPLTTDGVRFCPGSQGGAEWNGPAYDPPHDALIVGQVDWCSTVRLDPRSGIASVSAGQPWTGSSRDGFGKQADLADAEGYGEDHRPGIEMTSRWKPAAYSQSRESASRNQWLAACLAAFQKRRAVRDGSLTQEFQI